MKNIKQTLDRIIIDAMKSNNKQILNCARLLKNDVRNEEINTRKALSEQDILKILKRQLKQRQETLEVAQKQGREELIKEAQFEIQFIEQFLPEQVTEEEIKGVVESCITELNITSIKDLGKVMQEVMKKFQGRADGKIVNQITRKILENV